MTPWIIVCVVIASAVGVYFAGGDAKTKQKLNHLFSGRDPKTNDQFYERFFSTSGVPQNVVVKVREIFQEHVPVDLSQLEADDDLTDEFRIIWNMDSLASVHILMALEESFDVKFSDDDAAAMKTFRAVVEAVCHKIREQQKR